MAVIEYKLKRPVDGVNGKIEVIRMRRPTFKDLKAVGIGKLKKGSSDDEVLELMGVFLTRLSGMSAEDIDSIDVDDVLELTEIFSGFFTKASGMTMK